MGNSTHSKFTDHPNPGVAKALKAIDEKRGAQKNITQCCVQGCTAEREIDCLSCCVPVYEPLYSSTRRQITYYELSWGSLDQLVARAPWFSDDDSPGMKTTRATSGCTKERNTFRSISLQEMDAYSSSDTVYEGGTSFLKWCAFFGYCADHSAKCDGCGVSLCQNHLNNHSCDKCTFCGGYPVLYMDSPLRIRCRRLKPDNSGYPYDDFEMPGQSLQGCYCPAHVIEIGSKQEEEAENKIIDMALQKSAADRNQRERAREEQAKKYNRFVEEVRQHGPVCSHCKKRVCCMAHHRRKGNPTCRQCGGSGVAEVKYYLPGTDTEVPRSTGGTPRDIYCYACRATGKVSVPDTCGDTISDYCQSNYV